ncbi:MAG TPA: nuclear transport factor 2 family protein [Kofleriaceae bacterium]|nr:nuclear transport factor 2 family protein [Kofleriaceae bacterium]
MRAALVIVLLGLSAGCNSNDTTRSGPPSAPPRQAGSTAAAAPAPAPAATHADAAGGAPAPGHAIAAERARAVLDAWLAAQNGGDFAAYEKLYASRFEGVKRVGKRVKRFARAGWMEDRKRMFGKPMDVEAREPAISTAAASADVRFTQRWRSGRFEDLGPKRLLLVAEGDQLRIAREEMLRSDVVSAGGRGGGGAPAASGFLLELGAKSFLVLPGPAPEPHGALGLVKPGGPEGLDDGVYVASAAIATADLDPDLARLKGAKVRDDGGCEAEIVGFRAFSLEVPHFGTVQEWSGGVDGDGKPASEAAIAGDVFAAGRTFVGAELGGSCHGTYAALADRPAIVPGEKVSDAALEEKARDAFAGLEAVAALQTEYRGAGQKGRWWDGNIDVQIFKHPGSGQVIVSVLADNHGGCGDFAASAWAVYQVKGSALALLHGEGGPGEVRGAIDADADGRLELVTHDSFGTAAALVNGDGDEVAAVHYAYNDCPC